ncbi:MAG: hypothetical protein WBB15_04630 [Ornithinimicrobium sp.]
MAAAAPSPQLIRLRRWANWANFSTPLGLAIAAVGRAEVAPGPFRLRLASHYRWGFPMASAFTVGDVVISRHDLAQVWQHRPGLLEHEEVHARQWMACLGMPFLPLYLASMGWSWLRTGDRAAYCFFERHADLAKGGYAEVPVRPLGPALAGGARRLRLARAAR